MYHTVSDGTLAKAAFQPLTLGLQRSSGPKVIILWLLLFCCVAAVPIVALMRHKHHGVRSGMSKKGTQK